MELNLCTPQTFLYQKFLSVNLNLLIISERCYSKHLGTNLQYHDYQSFLIFQVSLCTKGILGTLTECVDYVQVSMLTHCVYSLSFFLKYVCLTESIVYRQTFWYMCVHVVQQKKAIKRCRVSFLFSFLTSSHTQLICHLRHNPSRDN